MEGTEKLLGIDIGGTSIKAAVVDTVRGVLLSEKRITTTPKTMAAVVEAIKQLIDACAWRGAIGCGFPGVVKNGVIHTAANLSQDWIGVDLGKELSGRTSGALSVINDADAAGLAEMNFGIGRARNRHGGGVVILFTLGTGIGSAMFVDGHLVPNTEFGHIEMNGIDAEKLAATVIRERENLSWQDWGKRVNQYLNYMEKIFSPDCIIIGGGVSESPERFFPYLNLKTEVLAAKMGNDAGIIGAAMAAVN